MVSISKDFILDVAKEILSFHSPSGFCFEIMEKVERIVNNLGYDLELTNKGCGVITIPGESDEKVIGLAAHVDTLGAMVRSITPKGTLKFDLVGGPIVPTLDSEYCIIRTREGKEYTGTFLSTSPSIHVFDDASALIGLLELLKRENIKPKYKTKIFISVYEEVGHGASYLPEDITEFIAVDMGCIGDDLSCTEYDVSICAKDSGGPYDYKITSDLIELAKNNNLSYAVDIYPRYGSDVGAALRGGNNIKGGLIGPGVHASHGMERTHYDALENTIKLIYLYLTR